MLEKEYEIVPKIYCIAKLLDIERKNHHNLLLSFQDSISDFSRISYNNGRTTNSSTSRTSSKRRKPFKTTNAYFYWVTREQG